MEIDRVYYGKGKGKIERTTKEKEKERTTTKEKEKESMAEAEDLEKAVEKAKEKDEEKDAERMAQRASGKLEKATESLKTKERSQLATSVESPDTLQQIAGRSQEKESLEKEKFDKCSLENGVKMKLGIRTPGHGRKMRDPRNKRARVVEKEESLEQPNRQVGNERVRRVQEHSTVQIEEVEDDDEVINLLKEFDQLLGNVRMVKAHLEKHDISEGDPENIDENDELLWWYLGVENKRE